jgi:hypothetical protein
VRLAIARSRRPGAVVDDGVDRLGGAVDDDELGGMAAALIEPFVTTTRTAD